MPCTTILVGKNASYDGSTLVARNEDSSNGVFEPKRMRVVHPDEQPRVYTSVLSHLTVELPDNPMRYTSVPDVVPGHGIWAEAGFNELNVGMSATETLTTNERVRGADPLVDYVPAKGNEGEDGYVPAQPGGLGEEDMVTLVLPYAKSARDGVRILGDLLERYGTYENNGIAFSDVDEIWWLETIGGHHWIAKRVPDDAYVTMPNQLGIDSFDLDDAEGAQADHMCSADLRSWMAEWHLDLTLGVEGDGPAAVFNPREAFGSHSDSDHVYNTPRAWYMQRCLNPSDVWDGPEADYTPESGEGGGLGSEESSAPVKYDSLFAEIARDAVSGGQISTSMIQRNYEVGFNRAGRIMMQLERAGIVGRQQGAKPRDILYHDLPSLEARLQELGLF